MVLVGRAFHGSEEVGGQGQGQVGTCDGVTDVHVLSNLGLRERRKSGQHREKGSYYLLRYELGQPLKRHTTIMLIMFVS